MVIEIRPAAPSDATRIAEIHIRTWQAAYRGIMPDNLLDNLSLRKRLVFWRERLAAGDSTTLVATVDGLVQGWLVYGTSRDADATAKTAEVYGLYVDPDAWRLGLGTALWHHATEQLNHGDIDSVTLWVLEANGRARRFYESIGFELDPGPAKKFRREDVELDELRYRFGIGASREGRS